MGYFKRTMGSASHFPYGSARPRVFRRRQLGLPMLSERSTPCRSLPRARGLGMRHEKTLVRSLSIDGHANHILFQRTEKKYTIPALIIIRQPAICTQYCFFKIPEQGRGKIKARYLKWSLSAPCNRQIDLMRNDLSVEFERFPRWPGIRPDATVVPSFLVVLDLL